MLRVFSTFTGVGSPEMALKNLGVDFTVVGVSEVDKNALLAYKEIHHNGASSTFDVDTATMVDEMEKANIAYNFSTDKGEMPRSSKAISELYEAHKTVNNFGDIRLIDERALPDFDLFTYSFPCKNISVAGGQAGMSKGSGTQSSLLWECERIIEEKRPKFLLMENVKNLVGKSHISELERWISRLEELGYSSKYKVLNACNFGLPQNRERVMMVSVLGDKCRDLPSGCRTARSIEDIKEPHDTVDEMLFYVDDEIVFNSMTPRVGKLNHVGNVGGKCHSNKRVYNSIGYAPTLNSMNGGNRQPKVQFKEVSRRLSPLECWRLQGYADEDFHRASTKLPKSKLYERSGRGIAVPMLEEIFKTMELDNV